MIVTAGSDVLLNFMLSGEHCFHFRKLGVAGRLRHGDVYEIVTDDAQIYRLLYHKTAQHDGAVNALVGVSAQHNVRRFAEFVGGAVELFEHCFF